MKTSKNRQEIISGLLLFRVFRAVQINGCFHDMGEYKSVFFPGCPVLSRAHHEMAWRTWFSLANNHANTIHLFLISKHF